MSQLRISAWGIKNPVPVAILFLALVLVGLVSYSRLPIKQRPNVTFPDIVITITENGAAPSEVETQITRPIENAMAGLPNVETIQSTVTRGVSTTQIEFPLGADMQKMTDDVRTRVDQTRVELPRDIDPPTVQRADIDSEAILTFAVTSPGMSDVDLSWYIDDTVARTLQAVDGVAQVQRVGGVNREINVIVDPDKLAAFGLTAPAVNDALRSYSLDASGGQVEIGGRRQTIRVLGTAESVAQLRNTQIPVSGGRYVRLSDVAEIGDGSSEIQGFARLDGRPVVGFQLMKTRDASDIAVEDRVLKAIHDQLECHPEDAKKGGQKDQQGGGPFGRRPAPKASQTCAHPGIKFTKVLSTVDNTRNNFKATEHALLEGMLLASLVVFLFLKDWRATLITAVAMPVSLIPTFAAMVIFGFSLNTITLLSLTLVIGILVDDAIVEIENIQKRVDAGARPYRAAIEGADAIGLAVVATTCTIVMVFVPVSFMPGIPGQFFKEFGLTVSVAVLFSLLTARLLTPLLAAYFLKPAAHPHERGPLRGPYRTALEWSLSHRWLAILGGALVFVGSIFLARMLQVGLQPPGNPDYYYINIQGPPGGTPGDMEDIIYNVNGLVAHRPETLHTFATAGSTASNSFFGGGTSAINQGTVIVVLKHGGRPKVTAIKDAVRPYLMRVPDARVTFDSGDFGSGGVTITLTSENGPELEKAALELQREMHTLPGIANPVPGAPPVGPELVIRPKPDEAARLGVSMESLSSIARVATIGDIDANVAKYNDGPQRVPIRVRLPESARTDLDLIRNLKLPTATGQLTTLGSVADVYFQAGPAQIQRFDRMRRMSVQADRVGDIQLGTALQRANQLPIMKNLPPGVQPAQFGENRILGQFFSGFVMAIISGLMLVYAVMALLFQSFFKPMVILSALPLAIGGAFFALLLGNMMISLPSAIGLLMLLGLAAKNSILLVEYAIERERAGASQRQALIEACRERARPIVMTTLAMQAGMLPTALGLGSGAEFRQPMAIAVIGGLLTSTALSLVLVPVVYEFVDDLEQWLAPKFGRLVTPREPALDLDDEPAPAHHHGAAQARPAAE
jgi:HAE1 family hydrophobic/amphiphilic exporter-1